MIIMKNKILLAHLICKKKKITINYNGNLKS